ncbi:hypothetical protein SDC9_62234 [bioreactor metagenome]|uniref:Erythromycin biosynthesis protein CIII-like C-terminal domain-containing protein n=1 Tax=bioreactor metagenome TaxID=1076179 RepID=A0A644XI16_9ZZZZ
MKVLIVPMSAVAQMEGPFSRAEILAKTFLESGIQVALCGESSRVVSGTAHYFLSTPIPMGLPKWLGSRVYPFADRLGIIGRKTIHSFEEVLHVTGASAYPYLKTSIGEIRSAIRDFQPDIVYSEFNLSAMIAAKAESKPLMVSYSFPTQPDYAASPQFAGGVNRVLKELKQPQVKSALDLFLRADCRVIPSSDILEPVHGKNNLFVGPLKKVPVSQAANRKNCILVYLGNGTIPINRIRKVVFDTLRSAPYEVFLAGMRERKDIGNIHLGRRFDFSALFPRTAVYINHGGQNSMMDGFLYGIPQLVCPGKVFERKYSADSVVKNGAGIAITASEFSPDTISKAVHYLTSDESFRTNAEKLGKSLRCLGGTTAVLDYICSNF